MQTLNSQFVTYPPMESAQCKYSVGLFAWVVRVVVAVLLLSAGVQAGYKPVDISDITGEKRKAWAKLSAELKRMPPVSRDCYICEQLGLTFSKDASRVLWTNGGYPATTNYDKAYFVGRGGKPIRWLDASNAAHERWAMCYWATTEFKAGASLVPFKKEVQIVICNTAKYLLKIMPKGHRWAMLALMGNMVYNERGPCKLRRAAWTMENGITVYYPRGYGESCTILSPAGKEYDIRTLLAADENWRWRHIVWRCENLVGAKDILALFPEEVEAMRAIYKMRMAEMNDEIKAKNDEILTVVDDEMSALPREKRLARIALAMGLYYVDHIEAGYANGRLNPGTTVILPDGTKLSGQELADEKPGLLQQVPHDAILGYYRIPIEQMARALAEERFRRLPSSLRDLLRAQLTGKLIKRDRSPAEVREGESFIQTFDRTWRVPSDEISRGTTYFEDSNGEVLPYAIILRLDCRQTVRLVHLCAHILGKTETANLIPPGNAAVQVDETTTVANKTKPEDPTPIGKMATRDGEDKDGSTAERKEGSPSIQTAMGHTTRKGADSATERVLAHAQAALGKMTEEQRRAWLAEKMGFCFTEDGSAAYQSERTADENAVYVDAQGRVRKLSEMLGRNLSAWDNATSAARLAGYDMFVTTYKEEIRQLAVQTSKHILTSMPPEMRQTWLAERNRFIFRSNPGTPYREVVCTLESRIKIAFRGCNYEHCLYYDPNGKIVKVDDIGTEWKKRWWLLYYCEIVAGTDAINELFSEEVDAMRVAYKKSRLSQIN